MGDMNNPNKSLVKAIAIDISKDRLNLALHQFFGPSFVQPKAPRKLIKPFIPKYVLCIVFYVL